MILDQQTQERESVMTLAVAKSLAISTIEQLNKSDIKDDIASDKAHSSSINTMVTAQLQESILNKA
jgi:hypothetical protein